MNYWTIRPASESEKDEPVDIEILEESALAMAQATIQSVMNKSGVSKADLARRMKCHRSHVSRIMTGDHNLTVKTMARALGACGFEIRFKPVAIEWNWVAPMIPAENIVPPANAGTIMLLCGWQHDCAHG